MPAQATTTQRPYRKKRFMKRFKRKDYRMAKIAKQVAQKVVNRNVETKHDYSSQTGIDVLALATDIQLTQMTTGTMDNDIIGSKCRLTSLYISYTLALGDSTNYVRLLVFQDKHQNLTTPNFQSQIFINSLVNPIGALYNVDVVPSRYSILYDKVVALDSDDPIHYGRIVIKRFPKRTLEFTSTPTITNAIASGHVYFMVLSDSALVPSPKLSYDAAIFYKDA